MKYGLVLATLLLALQGRVYADSTTSVLECMRANVPPTLRIRDLEFTSTDRIGRSRTMKGRFYATREGASTGAETVRAMFQVTEPAPYAGAAYLLREGINGDHQELFAYLPAVRRVRRISGAFAESGLLGTNFSSEDFHRLRLLFEPPNASFEGVVNLGSRAASVISFQSSSSSVRMWVDQTACLPVKAEFSKAGIVEKRLLVAPDQLQRSNAGPWYISQLSLDDLTERSSTVVRVSGYEPTKQLASRYFDPQLFYVAQ